MPEKVIPHCPNCKSVHVIVKRILSAKRCECKECGYQW